MSMLSSRAVTRPIEPGSSQDCVHCGGLVKFSAKVRASKVIANVYQDGVWRRVEHYHAECYDACGQPYGEPA